MLREGGVVIGGVGAGVARDHRHGGGADENAGGRLPTGGVVVVVGGGGERTAARLQLGEDLGEVAGLGVDAQHLRGQLVDDVQAAVPEALLGVFDEERLQRVGDLVAHVGVREVEAGEHDGLQILLAGDARRRAAAAAAIVVRLATDEVAHQHVDEHHVGRIDERHVLKTQQQQQTTGNDRYSW